MKKMYQLGFFFLLFFTPVLTLSAIQDSEGIPEAGIMQQSDQMKYDLTICAIFRNEGPYLKEWIEFHRLVGVQHIILYNHLSTDNSLEVLQPYVDENYVEVIEWTEEIKSKNNWGKIQSGAYNDGIKRMTNVSRWVAYIDSDEFLIPVQHDNLVDVLKEFESYAGVCAHWQVFGTSNVKKIPEHILQVEALLYKAPKDEVINEHIKSIVQPDKVVRFPNPHYAIYKKGFSQVDENHQKFNGPWNKNITINKLRINHYWTRDEDYFYNVKLASRAKRGRSNEKDIATANKLNVDLDTDMFRFVPALRAKMGFEN